MFREFFNNSYELYDFYNGKNNNNITLYRIKNIERNTYYGLNNFNGNARSYYYTTRELVKTQISLFKKEITYKLKIEEEQLPVDTFINNDVDKTGKFLC